MDPEDYEPPYAHPFYRGLLVAVALVLVLLTAIAVIVRLTR